MSMQLLEASIRKPSPHVLIGDKSTEGDWVVGTTAPTSFVAIISTLAFGGGISRNEKENKRIRIKFIQRISQGKRGRHGTCVEART